MDWIFEIKALLQGKSLSPNVRKRPRETAPPGASSTSLGRHMAHEIRQAPLHLPPASEKAVVRLGEGGIEPPHSKAG
jgi:hypothetical protein